MTWSGKENFRASRATYQYLCDELRTKLQHDSTIRETVAVEKRVAITLCRLGTNVEYRTISHLFGFVHEVCKAIVDSLLDKYISIPRGNAAMNVVRGFEEKWGFPQCFGAVDGSHIPIIPPHDCRTDYFGRKGFHSIVLQALVDHENRFMNVNVGWPGSVHDARILSNSEVFRRGEAGTFVPQSERILAGVPVPVVILGDPAYAVLPWLIKPYPGTGLSTKARNFITKLSRACVAVECAFGRLKGRWWSLLKRNDVRIDHMTTVVAACCILHNMCEVHKDGFDAQWHEDEVQASCHLTSSPASTNPSSTTTINIRNALCDHIDNH